MGFPEKSDFEKDPVGCTSLWRQQQVMADVLHLLAPGLRHLRAGRFEQGEASLIRSHNRILRKLQMVEDEIELIGFSLSERDRNTERGPMVRSALRRGWVKTDDRGASKVWGSPA